VTYKWEATLFDDVSSDAMHVQVDCGGGEIETFTIRGLPQDPQMRGKIIDQTVRSFLADRARKRIRSEITAEFDRVVSIAEKASMSSPASPPMLAEFLISCLAPKNSAQAMLGDLQEMFEQNAGRFGEKQARRKYWMQVASSIVPLVWRWVKRLGLLTLLVDYFRSKFGL
jgi:hypothetical protein